jgi:uncharacterized protein (DUF305 family)
MKFKTLHSMRALWLGPVAALCLMSAGALAQTTPPAGSSSGMPPGHMQMGADDMKKAMMSGMEGMQNMPMSGDTDKDFATMMKMHHQQAVNMAQMELTNGKSPEMKAMAKRIIAAQKKEIAEFDKWLAKNK